MFSSGSFITDSPLIIHVAEMKELLTILEMLLLLNWNVLAGWARVSVGTSSNRDFESLLLTNQELAYYLGYQACFNSSASSSSSSATLAY